MSRISVYLAPNVRVSVKPHYLRRTGALEALQGLVDTSAPGVRIFGTTGEESSVQQGRKHFMAAASSVKVEATDNDVQMLQKEPIAVLPRQGTEEGSSKQEDPDLLDDAIEEIAEVEEDLAADEDVPMEDEMDLCWESGEQATDVRVSRPEEAFHGRCSVRIPRELSLARYFVSFLTIAHIESVVIPVINLHAMTLVQNWVSVTLPEYLKWIALFVAMSTIVVIPDKKAYWHKSDFAFGLRIDFSIWMSMEQFNAISKKMHVFTTPDARACYAADKLYQLRAFVDAYNDNLTNIIVLYLASQEYKTTADCNTCCIIRLHINGDEQPKKFDGVFPKTIATVLRLVESWFSSGHTVIADSWFGSPAMARAVKSYGLYSIMQVKKKRYWPRGMPVNDMVQSLDDAYGPVHFMKSLTDSVFIASLQDKKPKCVIANAGSTTPGASVNRWIDGRMHTFHCPLVFEEYDANKSAVDTANNRRDNMPSFHDFMKTYRWEMRCLPFFLAVAEANAFSVHKYVVEVENGMNHFEFRWRLAQSLLDYAKVMNEGRDDREPYQLRQMTTSSVHTIISLGKLASGQCRRLRCVYCHNRTQNSCQHCGKNTI